MIVAIPSERLAWIPRGDDFVQHKFHEHQHAQNFALIKMTSTALKNAKLK